MAKKKESISALEAAQNEYNEFLESLPTRQYIVEWSEETVKELINYFENEISWKFNESIGVEKGHKYLVDALANYKSGHITLDPLTIQALYVFISRKEGKGVTEAKKFYHSVLKPISEAIRRTKVDEAKLNELGSKIDELKVGNPINESEELVSEQETEQSVTEEKA